MKDKTNCLVYFILIVVLGSMCHPSLSMLKEKLGYP